MRHILFSTIATAMILLAGSGYGADTAPSLFDMEKAVRELGATDYRTRERASQLLWSAGPSAEAALRTAASCDDPEVKERAATILGKVTDGIFPDTPAHALAMIAQYKAGNRVEAINGLIDAGRLGLRSLAVLWQLAPDADARWTIASQVEQKARVLVPELLARGEFDFADALLEFGATTRMPGLDWYARTRAAWLLQQNRLKPRIAELAANTTPTPALLHQLVFLYRADGDLTNALACAVRLSDTNLVVALRHELSDWPGLAADPGCVPVIVLLGYQAAAPRLAGNKPAFEAALTNIHAYAEKYQKRENAWDVAKAFLVNGRVPEALACLTQAKRYDLVYGLLMPVGQTEAALRMVARARQEQSNDLPDLEWMAAGDLNNLGATNEARTIITGLLSNALVTADRGTAKQIGIAQAKGLINEAATLAAAALRKFTPDQADDRQQILASLFSKSAARADAWLALLRATAAPGGLEEHLARLHGYFKGKPAAQREFITLAEESAAAFTALKAEEQALLWQSLADAHAGLGQTNLIAACERRACAASHSAPNGLRLATALIKDAEWRDAATAARRAYELQPTPAALWAHGWALAKAGDEQAGRDAMDRADLLTLADEEARLALAELMEKCGANEMALRQQERILRLGALYSWEIDECTYRRALRADDSGDFATFLTLLERYILRCYFTCRSYNAIESYLFHIYWKAQANALLSLNQGRVEKAVGFARYAQQTWPCDNWLPRRVGPALEKAGRKDIADELFTNTFDCLSATVRRFPGYASGHSQLAWLCARTRRSLPAGLEHARQAVALKPDSAYERDTLAETLFQLGRRDEAVAEMKHCIDLAPVRPYFRRQLKRMHEESPATEPSAED